MHVLAIGEQDDHATTLLHLESSQSHEEMVVDGGAAHCSHALQGRQQALSIAREFGRPQHPV